MSNPKRHHVVPNAYLSGFLEDGESKLAIFSKTKGTWRTQKPKEVLVHNKYYTQEWVPPGIDKNILENTLGNTIEPRGLESLTKLFRNLHTVDDEDTAAIAIYLELQRLRVPRQAKSASRALKANIEQYMRATIEGREILQTSVVTIKESYKIEYMRQLLGTVHPYMTRMIWDLLEAGPDSVFVTSDSPVTFENLACKPPTEAKINQYGTIVLFPFSKRYCLRMSHPEYDRHERYGLDLVQDDSILDDGFIEIRSNDPLSKNQVDEINCSLFVFAEDLVITGSKHSLERIK